MTRQFRPRGIEADGLKYYQERNKAGDYVSVNPETADYYQRIGRPGMLEARATAIQGNVSSVCTTSVDVGWLSRKCRRVSKAAIPTEWLAVL